VTLEKLSYTALMELIDKAPNIYFYAAPLMLLSVVVEAIIARISKQAIYKQQDIIPSFLIGIGYVIVTLLVTSFTFYILWFFYYYASVFRIEHSVFSFVICFVLYDLIRYWAHRISHQQRFWWATHVTHHSSEQYNLLVAFRLSWVDQLKVIFFIPIIIIGFDPLTFFIAHQISNLIQFWQHTGLKHTLPRVIETIFVTPRLHQVHHAKNPLYIDKNYGSVFIVWDKMFGTYQDLIEQPTYGITKKIESQNPFYLVFHEFYYLLKDIKKTKSIKKIGQLLWSKPS
jgi:sterol desaturase/sphingolipid hydroxylase (fatty acid hydroxylase superfamily)